jgi:hypothetical protein
MESWHRHLEGWQLAVVAVGMALCAAVLVIPRSVVPREIPVPVVDRREEGRTEKRRSELAETVKKTALPFLVRATGEALRRYGEAEFAGDAARGAARAREVSRAAAQALHESGAEPLLALRAVQTELFVRAVTTWAGLHGSNQELIELGGGFARRAQRDGWVEHGRLVMAEDGLAELFVVRWTRLTGLQDTQPFIPTLNELRLYYRTLMLHPESRGSARGDTYAEADALLGYVAALHKQDPDYPADLANGILAFRQSRFDDAAELFASHLREHPSGPWRLRAQNYWRAARENHVSDEFEQ